jgi:hypothetical protein
MSLDQFFKRIDARYRIPRPANALHLDAFQAGVRLLRDAGEGLALVASGFATSFVLWKIADVLLRTGVEIHFYMMLCMPLVVLIGLGEASSLVIPYYRISQRLTHGSARWADVPTLKDLGLAHDNRTPSPACALRLGRLTNRYDLALPYEKALTHLAIFGPPGSGKSSSFIMPMAKDWSRNGSAIFLDPKGELFKYTARHFRRVYRLDLADPRTSDRWNFVPACRGDAELSHEIASIVVGFDFNKHYNGDPFWPQAETALMTSLLLHLPHIAHNPTPAMIAEFIAARGFEEINDEMKASPDPEARVQWGIFKKADREKTQGGIFVGLGTKLAPLRSPHAMSVMQSVTVVGKKPVALLFSTPQLCESRVCGPVTDVALQLRAKYGDKMEFIHQEVFQNNKREEGLRAPLQAFNLQSEPWLFVIDKNGKVTARLEVSFGVDAFEDAIQTGL